MILPTPGYSIEILKQSYKITYLLGANQLLLIPRGQLVKAGPALMLD